MPRHNFGRIVGGFIESFHFLKRSLESSKAFEKSSTFKATFFRLFISYFVSNLTVSTLNLNNLFFLICDFKQFLIDFFLITGDYLVDKYDGATEVRVNKRGRLSIRDPRYTLPTANDLVYLDDSPNYCLPNLTIGSLGTQSRSA